VAGSINGMPSSTEVQIGKFEASFHEVRLPMGLTLERVLLAAPDGGLIDKDPFRLEMPELGTIEARVTAAALQDFLEMKSPGGLSGFKIELEEGKVYVQATARVIMEVRASAVCTLSIHDGRKLFVDLESVDVMGLGGMRSLVQSQLDQVNPVLDVSEIPLHVVLQEAIVADGAVTLKGLAGPKR
jgi:hypothetical protein